MLAITLLNSLNNASLGVTQQSILGSYSAKHSWELLSKAFLGVTHQSIPGRYSAKHSWELLSKASLGVTHRASLTLERSQQCIPGSYSWTVSTVYFWESLRWAVSIVKLQWVITLLLYLWAFSTVSCHSHSNEQYSVHRDVLGVSLMWSLYRGLRNVTLKSSLYGSLQRVMRVTLLISFYRGLLRAILISSLYTVEVSRESSNPDEQSLQMSLRSHDDELSLQTKSPESHSDDQSCSA